MCINMECVYTYTYIYIEGMCINMECVYPSTCNACQVYVHITQHVHMNIHALTRLL